MERMIASLLVFAFASVQTVAAAGLVASPLLGSPGGGDPFDDGVTAVVPHVVQVASLLICHGDGVDGIQANYTLQDGRTIVGLTHGMGNKSCTKEFIKFKEGEMIVHIEGKTQLKFYYVSQLTLYTETLGGLPSIYGPFGRSGDSDVPFSLAGTTVGFFGRAGQVLDALGLYINSSISPSFYRKTDLIGGGWGDGFDDFSSTSEKPSKISSMIVNYGTQINGIKVTYTLPSGASSTVLHGSLSRETAQYNDGILDFYVDEWITQVNISSGPSQAVEYLMLQTTNSKGSVRSYGPFGESKGNVTTIRGVVYGFYGRSSYRLNALGFYI